MPRITWRTDKDGIHVKVGNSPEVILGSGNISYREPMKYQIFHKYQDSSWMETNLLFNDFDAAVRKAQECSTDAIAYGMTAVRDLLTGLRIVEFPGGGGYPYHIATGYTALVTAALEQKVEVKKVSPKNKCPDCKDGFYYPLVGPKEPCSTCSNLSNDSKLIMHLQDVWADHPWGLTKISKPINTGNSFAVDVYVTVEPDTMPEIINDKLVDRIVESMYQYKVTEFYEFEPPVFNIINFPNRNREINVCIEIGFL